jgi:glyoxylase-like metal-dependent hydrolase (beta-lactamase superfamily II)
MPEMDAASLSYPHPAAPEFGRVVEVAKGVLWVRFALPFRLDHINIYLIDNGNGWTIFDAGLGDDATIAAWEALISGPLRGERLSGLIISHLHPDHIGLAGWLCERFGMPLMTSLSTWYGCLNVSINPSPSKVTNFREHYRRHGLNEETTERVIVHGHHYLELVKPLPTSFRRLVADDKLMIGGREFHVLTGDGHAPEQVMLYCEADGLFLGADQVLAKITPNVSVWAEEPMGNPLGLYLRSLNRLSSFIAPETLVLPGHQLPFYGLHQRIGEIADHHAVRCRMISDATKERALSVAELVPVLFPRVLDPHQLGFAFSEAHAHVNYMADRRELLWTMSDDGVARVAAASASER